MYKSILRKILLIALVLSLTAAPAVTAHAEGEQPAPIMPCYTGVSLISAGLNISPSNYASCSGTVQLVAWYTGEMTMELQKSSDDRGWWVINQWTLSGSDLLDMNKVVEVIAGYYYRVKVEVEVYDAYGNYVEKVYAVSNTVHLT